MSLNNLATMLSELGRREEALTQAEEAVRLYRQLAAARPDAFLPNLAMSLNNLANRLSDLGRREEALAQAEEAVRLRRQLAAARPDAFLPALAKSLAVCGNIKAEEQPAQALICYEESLRLLTPPFLRLPQAHAPLMQGIVGVYFQTLQTTGQEPDMELLTLIIEQLQRLEDANAETPGES